MNITYDFAFFLLSGTVITGVIWLADIFYFAPRRKQATSLVANGNNIHGNRRSEPANNADPIVIEYAKSFFPVLLIVFMLRGFIVEPFRIPSGSMIPTLYIGDFILVNKFAYGIKMPVFNEVLVEMDKPERGDVVVFKYPLEPTVDYIKRVVGLPGDHIAYYNKVLYVNGKKVKSEPIGEYSGPGEFNPAQEFTENLLGVSHNILTIPARPGLDGEYVVPDGNYFMMGDNRDNSNDSRYWGVVDEKYLVGKAFMIWMHWDGGIGFGRIGTLIE